MSLLYVAAGIYHFAKPAMYISIMPAWLPYHAALVQISGIAEILLGILLLFTQTRKIAAWGIIALLVAVFPANVQMLINYLHAHNPYTWIAIIRLPLQLVLIWWAWLFTASSKAPR
jgi:uncharacterized membrane protein